MKVVLDATTLDGLPSGAATRMAALGAELHREPGLQLVYLVRPEVDPLPGLPCLPWRRTFSPWRRLRLGPALDRLLAGEQADLFQAAALPLARVTACPQLLTLHDLRFLHEGAGQSLARRLWARHRLRPNLRRAARLVCVSETTRDELLARELLPAERLVVVPNGPTPGLHRTEDTESIAAFRRRADLNCRYLVAVGPLAAHKRVGDALDLLACLRASEPGADLALAFVGRAPPEQALTVARRAERMGLASAVRLVGVLGKEELAVVLSGAEALLSLGRSEGFAIPVLDAARLGLPVVAVAAGAHSEVAGDGAWLVPPERSEALAAAVLDAITPGRAREQRLLRAQRQAERWSWPRATAALLACWRDLAPD